MSVASLWLKIFLLILFYLKHPFLMRTFRLFFLIADHQWGILSEMQAPSVLLYPWCFGKCSQAPVLMSTLGFAPRNARRLDSQ